LHYYLLIVLWHYLCSRALSLFVNNIEFKLFAYASVDLMQSQRPTALTVTRDVFAVECSITSAKTIGHRHSIEQASIDLLIGRR